MALYKFDQLKCQFVTKLAPLGTCWVALKEREVLGNRLNFLSVGLQQLLITGRKISYITEYACSFLRM